MEEEWEELGLNRENIKELLQIEDYFMVQKNKIMYLNKWNYVRKFFREKIVLFKLFK